MALTGTFPVRRPSPAPRVGAHAALLPFVVGALIGIVAIPLADLDLRWMVWGLAALTVGIVFLRIRDKEKLLWSTFIIGFQADMYFRVMPGRGAGGIGLAFISVVGIGLVGWYVLTGEIRRYRPLRFSGYLRTPIAAFFATSLLSLLTTSERFVGLSRLVFEAQLFFVYLIALNLIRTEERLDRIVKLLFVCLLMQSLVYFLQFGIGKTFTLTGEFIPQGELPRPGGTVSTNPAGFASFVLPIVMLAGAEFLARPRSRQVRVAAILLALGFAALALTFTRAAWASLAISLVWLVVLSHRRGTLQTHRMLVIAGALGVVILCLAPLILMRLSGSPLTDAYDERAWLMRMALRVIEHNPITGVGAGAYTEVYKSFLTAEMKSKWLAGVHNEYLLRTAETGIPGGIAFVCLLVMGLRQAIRLTRSSNGLVRTVALGWSAALVGLAQEMYWDMWRGFTYNALLWFMLGLTEAAERLATTSRAAQGTGSSDSSTGGAGGAEPPLPNSSAPMSQRTP